MDVLIWKFIVAPTQTHMEMPKGARLIHAGEQFQQVCVWAECDPDAPKVLRKVMAIPTGGRANGLTYVGSAILAGGALVFHVYDGGEAGG